MVICFVCNYEFDNIDFYLSHLTLFHNLKSQSNFNCTMCPQTFQTIFTFKRHLLNKHKNSVEVARLAESDPCSSHSFDLIHNVIDEDNPILANNNLNDLDDDEEEIDYIEPLGNDLNVKDSILQFILLMFGSMNLSRKHTMKILNFIKVILLNPLINKIEIELNKENSDLSDTIKLILQEFKSELNIFQSEYKFQSYLKENDLYTDPQEFFIDNSLNTENNATSNVSKGVILPLKQNLKRFFELPNVLNKMINNLENLKLFDNIQHICQGSLWKHISEKFKGKIAIPYLLYQDDFEINNSLGSKTGVHKTSAFYMSFPLLPNSEISKLENIFVCYLNKSSNMEHGSPKNYDKLCDILKDLEQNGINIQINGQETTVYFVLIAMIGDNLGIHTVLGLAKSFQANFYCRFCKLHRDEMRLQTTENKNLLRTAESYWQDIFLDDVSLTGLRSDSPFLSLQFFKVTENVGVDIMHDIFEGICHVELAMILKYFILDKQFLTLEVFNSRKRNFQYHELDLKSKSVDVSLNHITKQKFKMSASEMQCFIHYLPLMISDLVDKNDSVWKFLIILSELIDACLQPSFTEIDLVALEELIKNHHEQYLQLFEIHLLPKHHFIIHYPTVIRKLGPPRHLWAYRNEAKHKQSKIYANISTSRRNVQLSLAIKWQYNFAYFLFNRRINFEFADPKNEKILQLKDILENKTVVNTDFNLNFLEEVKIRNQLKIINTNFKIEDIVTIKENNILKFFLITNIVKIKDLYYIFSNPILIRNYNSEIRSFVISDIEKEKLQIISISLINYPPVSKIILPNNECVIKPKPAYS